MLKLVDVDLHYGCAQALRSVSLEVHPGEIVALIGPNGAGKSSVLKTISGLCPLQKGRIVFEERDLGSVPPEAIVAMGISHVPEGRRIFPGLTVYGNLEVATASWRRRGQSIRRDLQSVFALFPKLEERLGQLGWSLSGGEQQMLAIARGMMARPKLLMLDEPGLGLAPMLVKSLFEKIAAVNAKGTAILLVEQNARAALEIASRGYVMAQGTVRLAGLARELRQGEDMQKIYLGG